ncbi:MAG: acetyl-CoA carboxylase biotin carboxyl carrier protein, partial [Clostridia bacterium]|nr:acetyl-CoA carboxylase biotin carboxyl carrier protein [Clostridia bacterium]
MTIKDMILLMKHMNQNGINLLDLEMDGVHVRLEKNTTIPESDDPGRIHIGVHGTQTQAIAQKELPEAEAVNDDKQLVTAPVVGVFYSAPSPESEPFVTVGSEVEVGDTLCIIEAMKLMNEVTSHVAGVILQILVEDGQRVEYGQPLMRIE